MESGATKYCTNCKRDIAEGNFIMHEVHCRRNITLCKDCHEPVPRSEMEEHFEEYHKPVTCKCGETVEISKVEDHEKKDCAQRIKHCEYCELELPFIQMAEHLNYCGSRTECCPKCQRYIQNRDRDQHEITECAFPIQKPSATSQAPPMFDDFEGYDETTYHAVTNRFPFPEYVDPSDLRTDDSSARPSVRNVNLSSSQFYKGSKDKGSGSQDASSGVRNRRQRKNQDRVQNIYKNTNQRKPVASTKKDSSKLSNTLAADQMEADRLLALSISNEDDSFLTQNTNNNLDALLGNAQPSNHGNRDFDESELDQWENDRDVGSPSRRRGNSLISHSSLWEAGNESGTQGEVVLAPCEFCNKTFPLDDLILHQSGCQIESLDHISDANPLTSMPSNNQQQTISPPTQPPVLDNLRRPNLQRLISPEPLLHYNTGSSDEGSVMLPCEFCGVLLPCEFLPHHQFHCRESRPTRSNQEVESALQDPFVAPSSPPDITRATGRTRSTIGSSSSPPPKNRSTSRRQDDVMLRNMFSTAALDEVDDEGLNRQSSKVKRSFVQSDDASEGAQYSRPSKNTNSSRTGKNGGVKENDVDDYLAHDVTTYVGSHHRGTTLPLKASNKEPRIKTVSKKYTNSDYANDNLSSNPSSFQRLHRPPSQSNTAAARTLNNSHKQRAEREDSFHELLSQFDSDVLPREDGSTVGSVKKANSGKTTNKGTFGTERGAGAAGYVPSFGSTRGADSNRMKKTTNSNSVRLAANFPVPADLITRVPLSNAGGLEPGISSGISARPRGSTNRTSAKTRTKTTRRPSSPS